MARPWRFTCPWRSILALLSSVSLLIASSIPEDANEYGFSFTSRDVGRAVPDFILKHAPLIWLHSDDPFRPADILEHVRHTTPMVHMEPIRGLPQLDLDNLAMLNDYWNNGPVSLTANGDITSLPTWLFGETPDESGKLHNATSCVVITVDRGSGDLDAFYFYFYSYDQGANITQVLPPMNGLIEDTEHGMHFGDHVGDWEHNMIRFHDGKPTGIYYSQHSSGSAYKWDDKALSVENGRPIVYSAWGSHANWASPGDHVHDSVLLDYCDAGQIWDPVSSAYYYKFDPETSLLTSIFPPGAEASTNLTSFLYYSGIWGDFQYPDDHPRQKIVPYFGLKRYVSGPTGPTTKQLVRKRLFPDHPERKNLLQWGVGIYMSLYPCCFRGWRAWASGIAFIGLLVCIVLGIKRSLKWARARKEGYKKIGNEESIPLWELDYLDDRTSNHRD
ncbi:hypothetical protein HER10_EVM0006482 [Colletotrichum scovillei]|uniref:uncharacterized protein n=1 Tax=Colletotrichum scovillei TaxID=1209932 RepID=UPI0015C3F49D|nr:uncharacterized protein HER10_EVM0006482 [Colletotrichum scovillei]KAF4777727.1 hypothetical protein HER10_EVM0006482 [Colletotrichum scovillei]KAG7077819.1 vacuolar protein sorting-associated protein 62 [Colletotrichum scovillei]